MSQFPQTFLTNPSKLRIYHTKFVDSVTKRKLSISKLLRLEGYSQVIGRKLVKIKFHDRGESLFA